VNPLYLSVSFLTFSVLIFEISTTRLFSIYLSHHFAFIVVSIAMLGIGSAGTCLSLHIEKPFKRLQDRLSVYSFLAGITMIGGYILFNHISFDPIKFSWDRLQMFYFFLLCFIPSIPFFFSGAMLSTTYYTLSREATPIYASDLLGAGGGSLFVVLLLNNAGPEYAVISASTISLISSMILGSKRFRSLSLIILLINSLLLIIHPDFMDLKISPYKNLSLALKYPDSEHIKTYNHSIARIDTFRSAMIRFAPGLSLKYAESLPEQIGIAIDGGELHAVTRVDGEEELRFLDSIPSTIVYNLKNEGSALIVDPGGGLPVLMARRHRMREIHKVESNPLMVDVIKNDLGEFSGRIFEDHTWKGLGRSFILRSKTFFHYDTIDISMTGTTVSGPFGIMEDYRYTVEAFKEYLRGLKDDGILSISMYLLPPPRREFRVVLTTIKALEETGIKEIQKNIVAIRSWDTMTVLIKKRPFTEEEIRIIKDFIKERGFDFVYYPGIKEEETNVYIKTSEREYFRGFQSIVDPDRRDEFIKDYIFDIEPVHDENPFFHYYLKIGNIGEIYNLMGKKWLYFIEEGYLTPFLLVIILSLSILMILTPVIIRRGRIRPDIRVLLYFSMLGLGFMFIEVTLIQKHILILENPVYSLSLVLTTILISSGSGSILSSRFKTLQDSMILPVLSCIILIYSLMQPAIFRAIVPLPPVVKASVSVLSIIPLGLFMGIPFPMGIRLLGEKKPALIPLAWATNAFFSVLAPVMTIMIATSTGFRSILYIACVSYLIAYVCLKRL